MECSGNLAWRSDSPKHCEHAHPLRLADVLQELHRTRRLGHCGLRRDCVSCPRVRATFRQNIQVEDLGGQIRHPRGDRQVLSGGPMLTSSCRYSVVSLRFSNGSHVSKGEIFQALRDISLQRTYDVEPADKIVRIASWKRGTLGFELTIPCIAHSIELSIQLEPLVAGGHLAE
jgi:hypothetical protein